jgi:hypothetical protein
MLPGISAMKATGLLNSTVAGEVVAPTNPVTINNETASKTDVDGNAATASFTFKTDRSVVDQDGAVLDAKWLDAGNSVSSYQIRATKISGATPVGTLDTWLSLSSNRTWSLTDAAGATGTKTCKLTIEIRDAAAPNTLRDSATYTLVADSQSTAPPPAGTMDWADIYGENTLSGPVVASNSAKTMLAAGTLNFAYSLASGMTVSIWKNGVSLGQVASTTVANGDTVFMRATYSSPNSYGTFTGNVTVSGLYADSVYIELSKIQDEDTCVTVESVLPTHEAAGDVQVGDELELANALTFARRFGIVSRADRATVECVRITTITGIELECSTTAPIATRDGSFVQAPNLEGYVVPVVDFDEERYERVIQVEHIGLREVVHITVENDVFLAGRVKGRYLLHHNVKM